MGPHGSKCPPMQAVASVDNMSKAGGGAMEIPSFLRQSEQAAVTPPASRQPAPEAPPVEPVTAASEVPHVGPVKIILASAAECGRQQRKKNISDPFRPLTRVLQSLDDPANPLALMVQAFNAQADGNQTLRSALLLTLRTARTGFMAEFILFHARALSSPAMEWAVLLVWLSDSKGLPLERHALGLLCSELQCLGEALQKKVIESLESACQLAG